MTMSEISALEPAALEALGNRLEDEESRLSRSFLSDSLTQPGDNISHDNGDMEQAGAEPAGQSYSDALLEEHGLLNGGPSTDVPDTMTQQDKDDRTSPSVSKGIV